MENTIKEYLDDIVNSDLYIKYVKDTSKADKLKVIINYLNNSKNYFNELRNIINGRNNENYFVYCDYIKYFFTNSNLNIKLELINNYNKYEDIIHDFNMFNDIWFSISDLEKVKYLNSKKNISLLDNHLLNESIKKAKKNDRIFKEIISNKDLRCKIIPNTLELNSSILETNLINVNDIELCSVFNKRSYTHLLLKKCKSFKEFCNIYDNNKKIYNLIEKNSLLFKNKDNEKIHDFIISNPSFIGKFNNKYLDLFSVIEISKLSKDKTIDGDAYSTLIGGLYKYNNEIADSLFNKESLEKCSIHSIVVNPFHSLSSNIKEEIFNNYSLFNKFIDTIMIEAINDSFNEDDIVNILRNDTFVNDMSSYAIELLINKLSFKSSFNMLQRKNILNKINNLNMDITDRDVLFIKGFLDSPILIYKSQHTMIWEMLNRLNNNDILYYLNLPYIVDKLSNMDIINLVTLKDMKLDNILNLISLKCKFSKTDIILLINNLWKNNLDLGIFTNKELVEIIFNKDIAEKVDFLEVNYLYETIRMKSLLSKQFSKCTINNYTAVLVSYMTLGLDKTLKMVNNGNSLITLDKVQEMQKKLVNEKIIDYQEDNSFVLKDINKNVINNLNNINVSDIELFKKEICNNTYLDNIVYLMIKTKYDNYDDIVKNFFGYACCNKTDNLAKNGLINYLNGFVTKYMSNRIDDLNKIFNDNILKHFKLKEEIIYSMMKEQNKKLLKKAKFKLFVRALTEPNKEFFKNYFKQNFPILKIQDKYLKYINNSNETLEDIIDHILMPIVNERFDIYNCLEKLGINKPIYYDLYCKYLEDIKNLSVINSNIDKWKKKYHDSCILDMMNYMCYDTNLNFKISKTVTDKLNEYKNIISNFDGKIFIDKSVLKLGYKDDLDIYNLDEIIEYRKYVDVINNIIDKTYKYVNNNMLNSCILEYQNKSDIEYDDNFPLTNEYYELRKRVFGLDDIEKIFSGYDLNSICSMNKETLDFFNKHFVFIADGYYDSIVNNFGLILSSYKVILEYINKNNLDLNEISIIDIENILTIINFDNSIISNYINSNILKSLWNYNHYEILDLKTRINILIDLIKKSFKCIKSTIPYLSCKYENITIKTIDKYSQDFIKIFDKSQYVVGTIGNDFLHYVLLNKNGCAIGIYDKEILIGKIYGIRNGNTLFLNILEGNVSEDIEYYLKSFANQLLEVTVDDSDSINFVTIVNNDNYSSNNGIEIDSTLCPLINYPFGTSYEDFELFVNNNILVNPNYIYSNYGDNVSTLLAGNLIVDKDNFKFYDVIDKYIRKRNDLLKLSNNMSIENLNKIKLIMEISGCKDEEIEKFDFASCKAIYLGDDYVVFDKNDEIIEYTLTYDERANEEIAKIRNIIKEKV